MRRRSRWGPALAAVLVVAGAAVAVWLAAGPAGSGGIAWPWKTEPSALDPQAPIDPGRQYHLVVWDYRLPFTSPSGAAFGDATAEAIQRFERRYPNVSVDLHLLDPGSGPVELAQALAAGYPPDVYCSPFGPSAFGSNLQVPVGLYLDDDVWSRYHPVAWQAVEVNGTVWSWPRWLLLWPWLGNREALQAAGVDPDRVAREGWTRAEFLSVAKGIAGGGGAATALAAVSPAVALRDLLLPGHLAAEPPPAADAYWLGAEPGAVVLWLSGLREAGALEADGAGKNPGIVDSFTHGQSAVLVPASPWTITYLLETKPRPEPWQYTLPAREALPSLALLPPPHDDGQPSVVWVSAATVSVFRQARYRGDDQTRLAAELALELTLGTRPWVREEFLCVPASLSEMASWEIRCAKFGENGAFAVRALAALAAAPDDRLGQALSAINYGSWPVQPSTAVGRVAHGYLGPFLEYGLAPAAREFWDNADETPGELVNLITRSILEGQ